MAKVSNWNKFKLLLWKNCLLHYNRKLHLIVELILPAIFTFLLVFVRIMVEVTPKEKVNYPEVDISSFFYLTRSMESIPSASYPPLLQSLLKRLYHISYIYFRMYELIKLIKSISQFKSKNKRLRKLPKFELAYSPNTSEIYTNIIKYATFSLNLKYHGYSDAEELEQALIVHDYLAGVQFVHNMDDDVTFPRKLTFALRFPSELRTAPPEHAWTWFTMKLFPNRAANGPRNPGQRDGGIPVGYIREGFVQVQHAISMAFIRLASGINTLPRVTMKRFPYPKYIYDPLVVGLSQIMSLIVLLSFIYPCTFITKSIATEKEKQLKEVMKIMGLRNWIHWAAWFTKSFLMLSISAVLITILIKVKWCNDVAVLTYSSSTAVFFFLLIYIITSICFCFMMATFFSKANTAAAVTGLIWFVAYIPYTFTRFIYDDLTLTDKLALSLISNTAMGFAFKIILSFESSGEGLQWNNIFTQVTVDDSLSLGAIMIMMMISCIIYMIICLYAEQIYPGNYGVPKKWNFPFTMEFWSTQNSNHRDYFIERHSKSLETNFETEPLEKPVGILVKNLKKSFDGHYAVKGLSMNIYEDEITVLLGHNGAGKTTTISMLIGLYAPTSGTAYIKGYNICKNLDEAREYIGICPQHNVLFDDMSVAHHIEFFSRIKGLRGNAVEIEVAKYLKMLNLTQKAEERSSKLSGGMKRKLSLCCALCGNSKIVLCDEPSSGMDPAARRELWDLLQEEKHGRTMLLTTHYMDEADVLGDRIAIMYEGELKCYGTSFYLKKKYGSGYRLICTKDENCLSSAVTILLNKYIPNLKPENEIGTELSYKLPRSHISDFQKMFEDLEDNQQQLHLNGYGISITSMEEVFMKVSADENEPISVQKSITSLTRERKSVKFEGIPLPAQNVQKLKGVKLFCNQWKAMFLKKAYYTSRNKILLFVQNFMPIFFITTTILISRTRGSYNVLKPMTIGLNQYPKTVTILEADYIELRPLETEIAHKYGKVVKSYGANHEFKSTGIKWFSEYILELSSTMQERINVRYLAAATVKKGRIIAWLNNQAYHTAPLSLNLVHNAMAQALISPNAQITVINAPLPYKTETLLTQLDSAKNLGTQLAINLCFCMCFVSSFYVLFLIKERESRSKLLQFVGGVHVFTFWLTHLIWDMLTLTFTTIIIIATLLCFQEPGFKEFSEICRYFCILEIFAASVLPFTYLLSYWFSASATGFARMSILGIFAGMALFLVVIVMSFPIFELKGTADLLGWFFRVYPHFSLAMALNKLYINSASREACTNELIEDMSDELRCKLLPRCCTIMPFFSWGETGVLPEITYLLATGVLWFTIIVLREYKLVRELIYWIRKKMIKAPPIKEYSNDDVYAEQLRIREMPRHQIAEKYLILDGVTKCYGKLIAVNQISLCVERGECFGLIGINGAGKTTTFKMLTGDVPITFGDVYVKGMNTKTQMNQIYQEIGYCPQFDALIDDLTPRETLKIFCLIRGIPPEDVKQATREFAVLFGFSKHYRKQVRALSGGNKRKLSAAVAFIGNPSIVFLDEPTTSMDPSTRRHLWDVICSIRDAGNSVILTSHSMDECEALCTRLAIMVNGEFECVGSTQYLKNKFSEGLILKIKVNPNTILKKEVSIMKFNSVQTKKTELKHIEDANIKAVKEFVKHNFPHAQLQEEYRCLLTYYIPLITIKWSEIFGLMESHRTRLDIEDYSISQTRLEEIFLAFAQFQKADPRESGANSKLTTKLKSCCLM